LEPESKTSLQSLFKDWTGSLLTGKRLDAPAAGIEAEAVGFPGVRLTVDQADETLRRVADRLAPNRPVLQRDEFNILALSGGAAGGAFGAGVLVGLTRAGKRPEFAIVTGVSTGALIAPMAFLGPDYDDRLTEAYVGGGAAQLLSLKGLGSALGSGLFKAEALDSLVDPVIDGPLVEAVAREHAKGRRLLIATTNLDSQKATIWDMGAIASHGGEEALRLFRQVLAASATLPGLFPPRMIDVESPDGQGGVTYYQEMHVDGGVAAPLFLMPDALLHWRSLGQRLRRSRVYVVVNTTLEPSPRTTPPGVPSIVGRSFEAMLRFSYRQALSLAAGFCARHNLPLSVTSIPSTFDGFNMMRFETALMREIFDAAVEMAAGEHLWTSPSSPEPLWRGLFRRQPNERREVRPNAIDPPAPV